jgi:hypothetical protein
MIEIDAFRSVADLAVESGLGPHIHATLADLDRRGLVDKRWRGVDDILRLEYRAVPRVAARSADRPLPDLLDNSQP